MVWGVGRPGTVWNVIQIDNDTASGLEPFSATEDHDLRDESARSARHPWWYAAIVALDTIAILAFIVWVAIPRLT
jgi:hypothetical protein